VSGNERQQLEGVVTLVGLQVRMRPGGHRGRLQAPALAAVKIYTLSEGEIVELHIRFTGGGGQSGRVRAGKSAGSDNLRRHF
jgi:hypothetical protein